MGSCPASCALRDKPFSTEGPRGLVCCQLCFPWEAIQHTEALYTPWRSAQKQRSGENFLGGRSRSRLAPNPQQKRSNQLHTHPTNTHFLSASDMSVSSDMQSKLPYEPQGRPGCAAGNEGHERQVTAPLAREQDGFMPIMSAQSCIAPAALCRPCSMQPSHADHRCIAVKCCWLHAMEICNALGPVDTMLGPFN